MDYPHNELHDALTSYDLGKLEGMAERSLGEMREYVRVHFSSEEEYLHSIDYPEFEAHKRCHDQFYKRINALYRDVLCGEQILNSQIMKTLTNWLRDHIMNEDMKYSAFAASLEGEGGAAAGA